MSRTGTAHFVSLSAALRYYRNQGGTERDVHEKIAMGEIFLGKPECGDGERAVIIPGEGRYAIESEN